MRAVNLLPERQGRSRSFAAGRAPLLAAGALALAGGLGWWGWSATQAADAVREDVAAATAERDALQARLGVHQQAEVRLAAVRARRGEIAALGAGRTNWERLVRDLAGAMPRSVWLTNLKGELGAAAVAVPPAPSAAGTPIAPPTGLHLDGFAPDQRTVALLMTRVATVRGLGQPHLTTSEMTDDGDRRIVHFVMEIPVDQRAQDRSVVTPVAPPAGVAP